jgi:hypothetical protein
MGAIHSLLLMQREYPSKESNSNIVILIWGINGVPYVNCYKYSAHMLNGLNDIFQIVYFWKKTK